MAEGTLTKECSKCKRDCLLDDFHRSKDTRDGRQHRCKECQRDYHSSPEGKRRQRNNHYLRNFGITLEEYELRLTAQNGVCAICQGEPGYRSLHVDHCHTTGKIRSLLCYNCNRGLGHFQHNPDLLIEAGAYMNGGESDS